MGCAGLHGEDTTPSHHSRGGLVGQSGLGGLQAPERHDGQSSGRNLAQVSYLPWVDVRVSKTAVAGVQLGATSTVARRKLRPSWR